jgi:type II secretory ATPase GspE/PulE/Tfp pilus assembly ATPase PilB-like protein
MNISKWFRYLKKKIFPNPSLQKKEITRNSPLPKGEMTEKISSGATLPEEMALDKRVSNNDIALAASQEFGVPVVDLDSIQLNHDLIKLIDKALIEKYQAIPIFKRGNRLFVAVSDSTNPVLKKIEFHTKLHTEAILVEEDKLAKVIECEIDKFFDTRIKLYPNPVPLKGEIMEKNSSRSPLPEKVDYNDYRIDEIRSLPSLPEEKTELDKTPPHMKPEKYEPVAVELRSLERCYQRHLMENGQQQIDIELVHARLADHYRDIELDFIAPKDFRALAEQLDEESQQRFALTVAGLENETLKEALPKCLKKDAAQQVRICFFAFAIDTDLLTIELLQQSPLRVEEFARQFLARLGAEIENETHAESQQRLMRLDYRRLLKDAEQAKASAEERMDYLRQLREEQESRLARRGKW